MSKQAHITPPSFWPIIGSFGLFFLALGIVNWLHNESWGVYSISVGLLILLGMIYGWFKEVIAENLAGLGKDPEVEGAFKWGMISTPFEIRGRGRGFILGNLVQDHTNESDPSLAEKRKHFRPAP